ncbi:MAG: TonB family protein [Undibacterium sp.]|nr:TonB family protein [Opitutaceae bacterium]
MNAMTNEETAAALKLSKFVLPDYPGILRLQGIPDGETLVAMSRDAKGVPRDVLALETTKAEFAVAAIEAVREWRFLAREENSEAATTERPRLVRFLFKAGGVVVVASPPAAREKSVAAPSDYKPVFFSDLDQMPKALRQPLPAFPAAFTGKAKTGEANVAFFVDETGKVRVPVVTAATAPEFAQAALKTVSTWVYEAPLRAGRPVVAYETLTIQFGPAPKA